MTATEDIESGHQDRVTVLDINYDGSKILTASIDHKVKVWNVDRASGERTLVETITAHDADIRDAKWLHPSTGTHLASIGNDLKFRLWQEDPQQAPNSGRRFKSIYTIPSKPRVPFVSLDFKNIENVYTYLALIDRQGLLSIYEPTNPDEFKDWTLVDQFNVCLPAPSRGEQTCFKVRFDQNVTPLPYINCVSDERRQLSLVVTSMQEVKIYRSIDSPSTEETVADGGVGGVPSSTTPDTASHRFKFYEAAKLPTHPNLVRDVQWAPFNVRGTDLFATACKDGGIRIFELAVSESHDSRSHAHQGSKQLGPSSQPQTPRTPASTIRQQPHQSSLTTAITNRNNATSSSTPSATSAQPSPNNPISSSTTTEIQTTKSQSRTSHRFPYVTQITLQANLEYAHDDAWSVVWDPSGQVLMSGGADGVTKIWRKSVLSSYETGLEGGGMGLKSAENGGWMLFADQAVELGGDGSEDGSDVE